jgi:glycylpeptide N-tetradecanoyltransferase
METKDVSQVRALMSNYLENFDLHVSMSEEETAHWFLPRDGVITTYVVENPDNHKVTDFFSFYTLCSSVMGNPKYNSLKAAYSFYNVATKSSLKDLMNAALITAHNNSFDVFNALDVMENASVFKDLKFGIGDGNLQYYLYNWGCPEMPANKVGLVLL